MEKTKEVQIHKFKKGQKLHLDQIYNIQGLGDNWYERDLNSTANHPEWGDDLVITRSIKITVTIQYP